MKKKLVAILIVVLAVVTFGACKTSTSTDEAENPGVFDGVDYYGCPNSKRVKKLNLKKR